MNLVDIFLIIIVLLAVWSGWQKGFIFGILDLVAWIGSLATGFYFYPYVANLLTEYIPSLNAWTLPVAFIGTIFIARLFLGIIVAAILKATPYEAHENEANH